MNTDNDKTILGKMETLKHIHRVRHFLFMMIKELDDRARNHDQSKLESPEAEIFGEHTPELAKTPYFVPGTKEISPEYKALLEKVKPALDHHYSKNRHHPEHWPKPPSEVDEIRKFIETLPETSPARKWLENYARSVSSSVNNMTLLDVIEMLCDWRAATERNKDGNIRGSIATNKGRYGISEQLAQVMENTVRETFRE